MQRGCIWWGSTRDSGDAEVCENVERNLLDVHDVAVDAQGRVLSGFADGCVARCVTEGRTRQTDTAYADRPDRDAALTRQQCEELSSQEDIGTVVRQEPVTGLYAAVDESKSVERSGVAALLGRLGLQPRPAVAQLPWSPYPSSHAAATARSGRRAGGTTG